MLPIVDASTWLDIALVAAALLAFGLRMESRAAALIELGERHLSCQSKVRDQLTEMATGNAVRDSMLKDIRAELRRQRNGK